MRASRRSATSAHFRVGVEGSRSFREDLVGAHAAPREIPHACVILGPVRVRVEVPRPFVAGIPATAFQKAHGQERLLEVLRSEAEILVVTADALRVEVDVIELARLHRLRDRVRERETGHRLVRDLGIHADHLGTRERRDEVQHVRGRREIDVGARLVGFRLEGEAQLVAAIDHVLAEEVHAVPHARDRGPRIAAGVGLGALAAAPEDVDLGAELDAEIDRVHRLAQRKGAHARVVGGESPVLEDRVTEEIGGGHRNAQASVGDRFLEIAHDPIALRGTRSEGDEIVVVEIDPVGADLPELRDEPARIGDGTHGFAERIAARIPHGPQTESEAVLAPGIETVRRPGSFHRVSSCRRDPLFARHARASTNTPR